MFRILILSSIFLVAMAMPAMAQEKDAVPESTDQRASNFSILLVVSPEGAEEYRDRFRKAAATWKDAAESVDAAFEVIGMEPGEREDDAERLKQKLAEAAKEKDGGPFWLVLIGHGTFDGRTAKFNVRGPDVSDTDLAEWLKDFDRPLAVINTASASGSHIKLLSGKNRVVITATKSAMEVFYARFGEYFAEAVAGSEEADIDNDEQVSLLEAFLHSADRVAQFYEMEGRLATEHALIDDSGDGIGTRPEWFEGVRATRVAKEGARPDGELAHQWVLVPNAIERRFSDEQRRRRDELETQIRDLVHQRSEIGDDAYYEKVEALLLEIARIYESVGQKQGETVNGGEGASEKEEGEKKAGNGETSS